MNKVKYGDTWETYCEIGGVECDVLVHYHSSPAEPDVNWPGGVDVQGVYFEDQGCLLTEMTDDEIEQLTMRLNEHLNDINNPDNDPRY